MPVQIKIRSWLFTQHMTFSLAHNAEYTFWEPERARQRPTESHRNAFWISLTLSDSLWLALALSGSLWLYLALSLWLSLWRYLTFSDFFWLFLTLSGSLWPSLALSSVWPSLSQDLLTKPLLGSQDPCSARRVATVLQQFNKLWHILVT